MDQANGQQPEKLEDQLRKMILTNVRTTVQPSQQTSNTARATHTPNRNYAGGATHGAPTSQHSAHHDRRAATSPWRQNAGQAVDGRQAAWGRQNGSHGSPQHQRPNFQQQSPGRQFEQSRYQGSYGGSRPVHNAGRVDPTSFGRGPPSGNFQQGPSQGPNLFQPRPSQPQPHFGHQQQAMNVRWQYLQNIAMQEVPKIEMDRQELDLKEAFRATLEKVIQSVVTKDPEGSLPAIELKTFGSLQSGFATTGSDMDVVIVTSDIASQERLRSRHEQGLPRLLEAELLHLGYGAHLLANARVPIIKLCERPSVELLEALRLQRSNWDKLPEAEKYGTSEHQPAKVDPSTESSVAAPGPAGDTVTDSVQQSERADMVEISLPKDAPVRADDVHKTTESENHDSQAEEGRPKPQKPAKQWTREKEARLVDFPKEGVGIHCDINFFNSLGLHNTRLLRCYSLCDPRVRTMILFVKAWVKKRKINSAYSGTLSSYGYVLMVLHYLANVAHPPVVPNLQVLGQERGAPALKIDGWDVQFLQNEADISRMASEGRMTANRESLGSLLRGFIQYFSHPSNGGFGWTKDVLSLRTRGGMLTKEAKGWTGAKSETVDEKEVRSRYLFAIEDPFEHTHNVARTVTHPGIVAIRDEFRRAYRILGDVGKGIVPTDGHLFDEHVEAPQAAHSTSDQSEQRADGQPGAVESEKDRMSLENSKEIR